MFFLKKKIYWKKKAREYFKLVFNENDSQIERQKLITLRKLKMIVVGENSSASSAFLIKSEFSVWQINRYLVVVAVHGVLSIIVQRTIRYYCDSEDIN